MKSSNGSIPRQSNLSTKAYEPPALAKPTKPFVLAGWPLHVEDLEALAGLGVVLSQVFVLNSDEPAEVHHFGFSLVNASFTSAKFDNLLSKFSLTNGDPFCESIHPS